MLAADLSISLPQRDRIREALSVIAAMLRSVPANFNERPASLARGHPGLALFHGYHFAWSGEAESLEALQRSVVCSGATLGGHVDDTLYNGALGLGWVLSHLTTDLAADDPCASLDQRIDPPCEADIAGYDLIAGLCGVGVYLLERRFLQGVDRLLDALLDALERTAIPHPNGIVWQRRPEWLGPIDRARYPGGYVDYGMAHGTAGVVALVARMHAAAVAPERTARLLAPACAALLSARLDGGRFPDHSLAPGPSRVAWCYGELGIAAALVAAADALDNPALRAAATESAAGAIERPIEATAVRDAGLCHGAAGIMHICQTLYRATGEDAFAAGMLRWLDVLLTMRESREGWRAAWQKEGGVQYVEEHGFLLGIAGIGLALLALLDERPPRWNRVLLLPQGAEDV